jgi:cell division septum initiation protein DivIVA
MQELETGWRETERLENENEELAARLKELTEELESAQTSLAQLVQEQEPEVAETGPRSVAEAVQEAAERCSSLVFLEEAFESAWDSPYQQPDKVLGALIKLDEIGSRYKGNNSPVAS